MNNSQKVESLWNYLFEGNDKQAWQEKFEICWDVDQFFFDTQKRIRSIVAKSIVKVLREKLTNYELKSFGFLEGAKFGYTFVFNKDWPCTDIFAYALEFQKNHYYDLCYGIKKSNEDECIPFKGRWDILELNQSCKDILEKIRNAMLQTNKAWAVSDWWVLYRMFDAPYGGMWEKRFYEEILEKSEKSIEDGCTTVAEYYVQEMVELIKNTESLVGEFVKLYASSKS